MKKKLLILFGLCFISFSAFSEIIKESTTAGGHDIMLYRVDTSKREYRNSYEFYIRVYASDEENFTFCFNKLNDAMAEFKSIETLEFTDGYQDSCRTWSFDAELQKNGVINYWIDIEYWIKVKKYNYYY